MKRGNYPAARLFVALITALSVLFTAFSAQALTTLTPITSPLITPTLTTPATPGNLKATLSSDKKTVILSC